LGKTIDVTKQWRNQKFEPGEQNLAKGAHWPR